MTDVREVSPNIYMIDNSLFSIPKWGSVYVLNEKKKALVETGPTTSAEAVLEGIREIGLKPEDIDYIIVTHIHLDHAGGAGTLVKHMPNAQVIVHPNGARHLIDPSRLAASALATRGAEVMAMHGDIVPVDKDRVRTVADGETIDLGEDQTLTFLDTPGHAPHHICITESRNGGVFTGDALALFVPDCDIVLPYHPPVQFDLELCLRTLERLERLNATAIYYSHFGVGHDVTGHIERAREKLLVWDRIIRNAVKEGTFATVKEKLIAEAARDLEPMKDHESLEPLYEYFINRSLPMSSEGHLAYYRKLLDITE